MTAPTPPPGVTWRLLHERAAGAADVAIVTLAPGASVPAETHAFDERIVVLSGTVRVDDLSESCCLCQEDERVIGRGREHAVWNWSIHEPAVYLAIMSGHVPSLTPAQVAVMRVQKTHPNPVHDWDSYDRDVAEAEVDHSVRFAETTESLILQGLLDEHHDLTDAGRAALATFDAAGGAP